MTNNWGNQFLLIKNDENLEYKAYAFFVKSNVFFTIMETTKSCLI